MWIRSQSKETLLKATKIFIHDNQVFASMEDGFDEMVGEYKSKERALEVLDGIQAYLENNYLSINDMPQHNNSLIANGLVLFPTNTKKVYQMPKE